MIYQYSLIAIISPLVGGILAGFLGKSLGKVFVNTVTILGILIAFLLSTVITIELIENPIIINQNI